MNDRKMTEVEESAREMAAPGKAALYLQELGRIILNFSKEMEKFSQIPFAWNSINVGMFCSGATMIVSLARFKPAPIALKYGFFAFMIGSIASWYLVLFSVIYFREAFNRLIVLHKKSAIHTKPLYTFEDYKENK